MKKEQPPQAPAPSRSPEPSALERMRDLTRRIVQVPKSEVANRPPPANRERPA